VPERCVGVIGASSLVGTCLLPLLAKAGYRVTAYTRGARGESSHSLDGAAGVAWQKFAPTPCTNSRSVVTQTSDWICVAPIWVLPEHFPLLEMHGVQRVVALSSTSRFSKVDSRDPEEQGVAQRLMQAEAQVQAWAEHKGVQWVVLRPTLIYGLGQDKNIAEIARFIRRFGFFLILGKATGLRQPVHAEDVACACVAALQTVSTLNRAYDLSGGETIVYRAMVVRVFEAIGRPVRMVSVPLAAFRLAVTLLRLLPRYRHWTVAMAQRMNRDLVFDHGEARRDLDFRPRPFALTHEDVAPKG